MHRVLDRLALLQINSVSALVRAHYLPLFTRLGAYPPALLEEAAWGRRRTLFEYWAHEASLLPLELYPLLRWRMERAGRLEGIYGRLGVFVRERRPYVEAVFATVAARGPTAASALEGPRGPGGWWGWSDAKLALEWLFWAGRLTVATRRGFERVYDLPERVLPIEVLAAPVPSPADAHRALLARAARALGIATASDLRDYFRLDVADVAPRLPELVESGELLPVAVEGWRQPAYMHREARRARRADACALLAPFDPLIWERTRVQRLFGFRYRLEIYTPAHKREHGYYVLPFLLGDRLVARVDLKSDRASATLQVKGAYAEPHAARDTTLRLSAELAAMAAWLGLDRVKVEPIGNLAESLRDACRS